MPLSRALTSALVASVVACDGGEGGGMGGEDLLPPEFSGASAAVGLASAMPRAAPLPAADIQRISDWIAAGAPDN